MITRLVLPLALALISLPALAAQAHEVSSERNQVTFSVDSSREVANDRVRATVGVTYSSDMALVRKVLETTAAAVEWGSPDQAPRVFMLDFADSAVVWEVSVWMDNFSTGMMIDRGTCDAEGKVFSTQGSYVDPMTGQKVATRSEHRLEGPDRHVLVMYATPAGGAEFKMMEIVYTRTKK